MVDVEGIVLHKLLREQSLEAFSDLKACFFSGAYSPIYRLIHKFYITHGNVPSFDELKLVTKNAVHINSVQSLEILEVPEVELELAISALIDQYAQSEALIAIDKFIDHITLFNVEEIKEGIGEILLDLDSKLDTNETIMTADQFSIFKSDEESKKAKVVSGISNYLDSELDGFRREDLILVGGKRGAGKSILCANLVASKYMEGKIGVYFTIEMKGDETFDRMMSILSDVPYSSIRNRTLVPEEEVKLAKVRADMFENAEDVYQDFLVHKDPLKFEKVLKSSKSLKRDNQIIIIDDRDLSITQIDLTLQKLQAKFGDDIEAVAVDYLNQITFGGNMDSMYDWKDQVTVSKQLKNIARKYNCAIVSPYQIDDSGATRFAKGILDACDMALLLDAKKYEDSLVFECTKSRSTNDSFKFRNEISWDTLKIHPAEVELDPEGGEETAEESKPYFTPKVEDDDL